MYVKIAVILLCAQLWRMGGDSRYDEQWRRAAVPCIMAWYFAFQASAFLPGLYTFLIIGAGLWLPTTLGYGLPEAPLPPEPLRCRNHYRGCGFFGTREEVNQHMKEKCFAPTGMNYNIPDAGSFLGRIFKTEELTRGVCGILYSIPFLYVLPLDKFLIALYINFTIAFLGSLMHFKDFTYERLIGAGVGAIVLLGG